MSQLNRAELRLTKVVREARAYADQLKELQKAITLDWNNLPTSEKSKHPELKALIKQCPIVIATLKAEIHIANQIADSIVSHSVWKNAVLEVFGRDGLRECFDKMMSMKIQIESDDFFEVQA